MSDCAPFSKQSNGINSTAKYVCTQLAIIFHSKSTVVLLLNINLTFMKN